jgi:5-methylcytosine-specific restriction endonuclease McrA
MTVHGFYRSREWLALRTTLMNERLINGELICARCGKPITKAYDCIGHHKIELTDENVNDFNVSLNPDNVELIHFRCHNIEHQRFEGYQQKVYLVYGSPCSGKSTWVERNALPDDLVLDFDKLWEAISISDRYHKPARLKSNAFALREEMLSQIQMRKGQWRNAYVIGGYPLRTERDRLCDRLGAEPVFLDEPQEVSTARYVNEDWRGYVREWFEAFIP